MLDHSVPVDTVRPHPLPRRECTGYAGSIPPQQHKPAPAFAIPLKIKFFVVCMVCFFSHALSLSLSLSLLLRPNLLRGALYGQLYFQLPKLV